MPLRFKRSLCTGCRICQLACTATHEKVFNPEKSRIKIICDYRDDGIDLSSIRCIFCKECEASCPREAISHAEDHMKVDRDRCIGCGTCVETCPTKVIYLDGEEKSIICDLCGGSPQCVQWCPKKAVTYVVKSREVAR